MTEGGHVPGFEHMVIRIRNFIPRKCSISYSKLQYWLTIPEFVIQVVHRMEAGERIDDRVLLDIMEPIYDELYNDESFNASWARKAINTLKRSTSQPATSPDAERQEVSSAQHQNSHQAH